MKRFLAVVGAAAWGAFHAAAGPFADYNAGIHANDVRIVGWATGWQDYIRPNPASGGYCHDNSGNMSTIDNAILGAPTDFTLNGTTKHVLSLGRGASITLTFGRPVPNRSGPDFAVFENAFRSGSPYLTDRGGGTNWVYYESGTNLVPVVRGYNFLWCEPAFVDVSSDGTNWARFSVTYLNTDVLFQATVMDSPEHWTSQDPTMIDGLAGKHTIEYGTAFDLATLTNHPSVLNGQVDLDNIWYIRITDVIGDGSQLDQYGNPIYSPYYDGWELPDLVPAPDAATDGFDLRGVALLETPLPAVTGVWIERTNFVMAVTGLISNQAYVIQTSTNLAVQTWSNETIFVAGPSSQVLTNSTDGALRKFYRIGLWP